MIKTLRQFMVKKLKEPADGSMETGIEWICASLGFLSSRDQDKTAFRIMKALIEASGKGKSLSSEELTAYVEPTIGSVIYHLKKLMRSGLVVKLDSGYELRMNSLCRTIEEIEKEIFITIDDIKKIASEVDHKAGQANRR
ncbi:MAG: ArsR family transcriptional regulator, partial [Candidatus Aminicenantes bacterium]|nr:ArsR family transcriptional regulator [Candidatus Aminicenantes bacterium]